VILRSFGWLTVGRVIGDLATFVLFVLISRIFGKEGIGTYSFAIALTGVFAALSELGTTTFTIRELAHSSEGFAFLFGRVIVLRLLLLLVAASLLAVTLPLLPFPREVLVIVALIGGYQLLYQVLMGLGAVFIAHGRSTVAAGLEALFRIATGGAAIAAALLGAGLNLTVSTMPLIALLTVLVGYVLVEREFGRPTLVRSSSLVYQIAREVLPYGLSTLFAQVQQRLDVILLGLVLGAVAAGVYNVAFRSVFMLLFIPYLFGISLLPFIARLHAASSSKLPQLYRRSLNLAVLLGLPAAAGVTLVAPDVIRLVFGDEFLDSVPLLRLLAWLFLIAFLRFVTGAFLTACGRQTQRTRAQGRTLVLAVVLYSILIPLYGPTGAALGALTVETLLVVLFARQLVPVVGWPRITSRVIMSAAATATFVAVFAFFSAAPLLVVVVGSVVLYSAVLLVFPQIRREELRLAVQLVSGRERLAASGI